MLHFLAFPVFAHFILPPAESAKALLLDPSAAEQRHSEQWRKLSEEVQILAELGPRFGRAKIELAIFECAREGFAQGHVKFARKCFHNNGILGGEKAFELLTERFLLKGARFCDSLEVEEGVPYPPGFFHNFLRSLMMASAAHQGENPYSVVRRMLFRTSVEAPRAESDPLFHEAHFHAGFLSRVWASLGAANTPQLWKFAHNPKLEVEFTAGEQQPDGTAVDTIRCPQSGGTFRLERRMVEEEGPEMWSLDGERLAGTHSKMVELVVANETRQVDSSANGEP